MLCPDIKYLTSADFDCVGLVAKHCNLEKLCIATKQALNFDLDFCYEAVNDILENWDIADTEPDYEKYQKLICGGNYEKDGKTYKFHGLKDVWVYFAYSRYKVINEYNDTANGDVNKSNEWSIPKAFKDVYSFSEQYKIMAVKALESFKDYLKFKGYYKCFNECVEAPQKGNFRIVTKL